MDIDFKTSFLANAQQTPEMGVSNLKVNSETDNKSFEAALETKRRDAEADKKSKVNETDKSRDAKRDRKTEKSKADRKETAESEESKKTDRAKKPEVKEKAEKTAQTGEAQEGAMAEVAVAVNAEAVIQELTPEQSAQLIAQVAEVLGVPAERVEEALDKLGLKPEDLAVSENVSKLVMEVKGLEEPAELLKEPEIGETLKGIKKAADEAMQNANSQTAESSEENTRSGKAARATAADNIEETAAADKGLKALNTEDDESTRKQTETSDRETRQTTRTEGMANIHAQGGANAGQKQGFESESREFGAETDETNVTPIVIRKGDETVVEIGGKTVSRSVARPAQNDVVNQIIDKMKIDIKPGTTEMKITLKPDELGSVMVKLVSEKGVVTAEIVTENSKVKELVEQNLDTLKESLKEQGVEVGGLSVSVGQQENDERMARFIREQSKTRARMSQIISKIDGEETESAANYANEADTVGYTVNYSA